MGVGVEELEGEDGDTQVPEIPSVSALRYIQPLREGGSLPAVVDTDDGLFVIKFRGAGQGPLALVAEIIAGQLARSLGLPIPDLALVTVDETFGRSEPDPEIRDLLRASHGTNLGLRYLDGAFNFAASAAGNLIDASLAARIVWFDALLTNPDRTDRNPNILIWQRRPWLIDHGAALYAHHDWPSIDEARTRTPFALIRDHVLLASADDIEAADAKWAHRLTGDVLAAALAAVPDDLIAATTAGQSEPRTAAAVRERYMTYLATRLRPPRLFVDEAVRARLAVLAEPPRRLPSRR
jgi:hypothetical protein